MGLQGKPQGGSSFRYLHHLSGYTFELGPAPATSDSDDDDEVIGPELEYNPVQLGTATNVSNPVAINSSPMSMYTSICSPR